MEETIESLQQDNAGLAAELMRLKHLLVLIQDSPMVELAIGGAYQMPDGRAFWVDGPVAREMARRVVAAVEMKYRELVKP